MPKLLPLVPNSLGDTIRSIQPAPLGNAIGSTQAVARPAEPEPYTAAAATGIQGQAESMYERIVRSIAKFEEDLEPDHEIGAQFGGFGPGEWLEPAAHGVEVA